MSIPLTILDATLGDEPLLEGGQLFVHCLHAFDCARESSGRQVFFMKILGLQPTLLPVLFTHPSRQASDSRLELHGLAFLFNSDRCSGRMLVVGWMLMVVLLMVVAVTVLAQCSPELAPSFPELVADGAPVSPSEQQDLQLAFGLGFLDVELQAGRLQSGD